MPHVAITGASRGIGRGLALAFAREGYDVTAVARNREALVRLEAELEPYPGRVFVVVADLSNLATCTDWLPEAEAALGPIDVLVNNAGRQVVGPTELLGGADASIVLDLNAPIALAMAVAPGMLARGNGVIVNVASAAAFGWVPGMAHYTAAKSGLAAWSESVRVEWLPRGVNVLTVYPGPVHTDMAATAMAAYGQSWVPAGTVEGLAARVMAGVRRRAKRVIYPAYYWIVWAFPNFSRWVTALAAPRPKVGDSAGGPSS